MKRSIDKKLERLQKSAFYYAAAAATILSTAGIIAAAQARDMRTGLVEGVFFVLSAVILAAYRYRETILKQAFAALLLLVQLKTSVGIVLLALAPDGGTEALVFREMLILGVLLALSIFAYTPPLSYALAGAATAVYAAAAQLSGAAVLKDSALLVVALFASGALMEHRIIKGMRSLLLDNRRYLAERRSLFNLFHIDDSQVSQFIQLLRKRNPTPGQTEQLLKLLGAETERRIRQSVLHLMQHSQTDYSKLDERIPSLTATERKVAHLILQGKTHPEIARELLKSSSNVSVIRSNIRKKLGLGPKDNLAESLHRLMQEQHEASASSAATL